MTILCGWRLISQEQTTTHHAFLLQQFSFGRRVWEKFRATNMTVEMKCQFNELSADRKQKSNTPPAFIQSNTIFVRDESNFETENSFTYQTGFWEGGIVLTHVDIHATSMQ